jgi:hypothetical protein
LYVIADPSSDAVARSVEGASIARQLFNEVIDRIDQRSAIGVRSYFEDQVMAKAIQFDQVRLDGLGLGDSAALNFTFGMPGFRRRSVFGFCHPP